MGQCVYCEGKEKWCVLCVRRVSLWKKRCQCSSGWIAESAVTALVMEVVDERIAMRLEAPRK